jgi:hypothetical protein
MVATGNYPSGNYSNNVNLVVGSDGLTPGSNQSLDGYMAELIIYDRALSDGERQTVYDYLAGKYTTQASLATPAAVPFSSGNQHPGYEVGKAIDGDIDTFSVVKDDTLTGSDPATNPPFAEDPVTGHMIFDLGKMFLVSGARLTSRNFDGGPYNPEDVDFFYFADDNPFNNALVDDIEGDPDIVGLLSHTYPGLKNAAYQDAGWDAVWRRYIGMRINHSYEDGPVNFNYQISEMEFYTYIPEPTTLSLLGLGALALLRRKRSA